MKKKLSPKGKRLIEIGILSSVLIVSFFFWDSFFIYPVKLFVVLLHESSHCLLSVITGGTVGEIKIDYNLGGYCIAQGGDPLSIALSGYIGSIIFGGILFVSGKYHKFSKYYCLFLAGGLFIIMVAFVKNMFGFLFILSFIVLLVLSPRVFPDYIHSYIVKILGAISCLYVIIDIKEDLLHDQLRTTDAQILAELTGVSAGLWGILILLISLIIFYFIIRLNFRKP